MNPIITELEDEEWVVATPPDPKEEEALLDELVASLPGPAPPTAR
jgi:hypothetical protein